MEYYRYRGDCLCPYGGKLPEGSVLVEEPFSPLVFLVERDPFVSRGYFAIHSLSELNEPEGINLLLPAPKTEETGALARFVEANGASVLNTAFQRAFDVMSNYRFQLQIPSRVHVVGLGNVGGTATTGLKLMGTGLKEIGIFDPNQNLCLRYEAELNQVLPARDDEQLPPVTVLTEQELFDCDAILFTAARAVPEIGAENSGDVRLMQYEGNQELLRSYAKRARDCGYCGLFAQISDPVDQLSRAVFLMSNQNEDGEFDWRGLLPEQVRGFGLGVMRARAIYTAKCDGIRAEDIRAYGPHGNGLVIANAPNEEYDERLSRALTHRAETENLKVRAYGYKPYIAPGLSSAAVSVLRALRGDWHDGAVPMAGVYFGCRARFGAQGPEVVREPLHQELIAHLTNSYSALKEFNGK